MSIIFRGEKKKHKNFGYIGFGLNIGNENIFIGKMYDCYSVRAFRRKLKQIVCKYPHCAGHKIKLIGDIWKFNDSDYILKIKKVGNYGR